MICCSELIKNLQFGAKMIMQDLLVPFMFQGECRMKTEHVLFPSVFLNYGSIRWKVISYSQFFGTNKNWILKSGSFEQAFRSWKWWTSVEFININGPGEAQGQACDKKFAWMVGIWQILKICPGISRGKVMLEIDWDINASNLSRGHRLFSKVRWLCCQSAKKV